jgi:two-component sensor histidine kinase
MLVALGGAVPLMLLTAGISWQLVANEVQTRRETILYSTRTLMNAVDAMLSKQVAVAQMLATSPALQADDLAAFRMEAERAMPSLSGGWIVLHDESGQQLVNLIKPPGAPLSGRSAAGLELQRRAIATGRIQISDVWKGNRMAGVSARVQTDAALVTVEVPIRRDGQPPLGLTVAVNPRIFLALFESWNLPEGWLAGLIDRNGNFIARSRDHEQTVGQPASEGFRTAVQRSREGWNEFPSLEGNPLANAHVTSNLSEWVMGLAVNRDLFEAPIRKTLWFATLAGLAAALLSLLLATWAARRIASPIEKVEQGTHALLLRRAVTFPTTGVIEVDRALDAFTSTARVLQRHEQERDDREQHVRLIMRELSHRSKNLLAIVLAIARQTARHTRSFEDFETRFSARVQALADAHDLLVEQQWAGATIEDLVNAQLAAFDLGRVACRGDRVKLRTEAVQNVALALHELATNASKYGSLSVPEGKVEIDWALQRSEAGERSLRLTWRETGGPKVAPPKEKGFGCFVLERVTINALGEGGLEFNEAGLVWTCTIRPEHLVDEEGAGGAAANSGTARQQADAEPRRRAS